MQIVATCMGWEMVKVVPGGSGETELFVGRVALR